jgi:DUF1680 family protein
VSERAGVVHPTADARVRLRPLSAAAVRLRDGFWADIVERNRTVTIPAGARWLERAGNLANFEAAATGGPYTAGRDDAGNAFPFLDSDVYKWLEAAGWELGRGDDPVLRRDADRMIALIERAQRPDGYLNTYVQLEHPGAEFVDLQWAHELYSAGHLVQAAVAWHRGVGDDRLLDVARRLVERIDAELGAQGRAGVDGHPEIEMALVELYRCTGEPRHLELARRFVELRGQGLLGDGRFGEEYWQDAVPVRSATEPAGHAVRQLYLDCGAVDVAVETGDAQLLDSVVRRWQEMRATRMYLTGALGSRHRDESFGDPFELPPDRAYAETCAAIASVMLCWRLLQATGDAVYAEVAERTLYNAVLPAVSLDGSRFFYVNPLQRRDRRRAAGPGAASDGRAEWFACACCPPNIMRLFSTLEQQLATVDGGGIQLHQWMSAQVRTRWAQLVLTGTQPDGGEFEVVVSETATEPWALALRVPPWIDAESLRVTLNGEPLSNLVIDAYLRIERTWSIGDRLAVAADVPIRLVEPDPRIDAVRDCLAVERGPLVYCIEQADAPAGVNLADLAIDPAVPPQDSVELGLVVHKPEAASFPYRSAAAGATPSAPVERISMRSVPYFTWGNRDSGAMRVWIPRSR